jgi:hypothetical protein
MKTKKVKINGQVELEVEEGMSVSEENGVVRVKSVASHINDMIDGLLAGLCEKWTPQVGEVVKTGAAGRYIMFIYSGVSVDGVPMGYENLCLSPGGNVVVIDPTKCKSEDVFPTTREDRIRFFSALEKAGWKYNSKKKELKRVEKVEKWAPKDGDFVTLDERWVSIYKGPGVSETSISDYYGVGLPLPGLEYLNRYGNEGAKHRAVFRSIRPSTPDEKRIMLSVLEENGLRWNADKKRVEKKRWRAEPGGAYERVTMIYGTAVPAETIDKYTFPNDGGFESGNYYKPGTGEAQKAADKINEIFKSNL